MPPTTPPGRTLKVCNCNKTMRLDGRALGQALGVAPITIHTELCRHEVDAFNAAIARDDCIVACTQEAPLFGELADAAPTPPAQPIRFVNIRETAGWSREGARATPKIAALLAMADLPEPQPVPTVEYRSAGNLLVIGPAAAALEWAERLADSLEVAVLATDTAAPSRRGVEFAPARRYPVWSGQAVKLAGHLGAFEVTWEQANPIDLERCTRCDACVRACPEQAIDTLYQVDLERCRGHRACVSACGAIGAIDFARVDRDRADEFDLVLDLSEPALIGLPQPPEGYCAPGRDPLAQSLAAAQLARLVGEFEKPRYFAYEARLCAHGRSGKTGCTNCIDVCSTGAIASAGDTVSIDAFRCMGCGGCATVCPSGAMRHAYPRVSDLGARVKRALAVYHAAEGTNAALLFHSGGTSQQVLHTLARRGPGLPARVIPLEVHHPAAVGLDLMLGAIAHGACEVVVLLAEDEASAYGPAIASQTRIGAAILEGLGYGTGHLRSLEAPAAGALAEALWGIGRPPRSVSRRATFNFADEKRSTLEFAIDHLAQVAPTATPTPIALAGGAPFGAIAVNGERCTLCKSCIGACPTSALVDTEEAPRLRFIERNCVQCGICANTCPEDAITLIPRLNLAPAAREPATLHEDAPFACVRCGKPFATTQMIRSMTARLTGHAMFAAPEALRRLEMCADCRVVDLMERKGGDPSVLNLKQ